MANLYTKVKLYIESNSSTWDDTKVSLQDDGAGAYIKTWSYSFSKPTVPVNAYESVRSTDSDFILLSAMFTP